VRGGSPVATPPRRPARAVGAAIAAVLSLTPATLVAQDARTFRLAGHDVAVNGDLAGFTLSVEVTEAEPGIEIASLRLTRDVPLPPPPLSLRWSLPSRDILGAWTSGSRLNKSLGPDWYPTRVASMLASNAPVFTLFGTDDGNRLTFALSEALNATELGAGVREEDSRVHGHVELFTERHEPVTAYEVLVRFDSRPVPYHRALDDVASWWADLPGMGPAPVPETARLPMYSTWYSYHQSLDPAALLREVEIARGMGFRAIIIDDGWQTLDSNRGYAFAGDWEPERIPDMEGFVRAVHGRGMELLLWYAVPLVGERSKVFSRFEGKYLRYWDGQGAYELDPRYPEVRRHVIDTYRDALRDWGVDGFKLDFLGRFVARESTVMEATDGRDYASVSAATDRLMTDLLTELRALDPDVMVEFRQPYVGPAMRKYGNMFRAGDAPNARVAHRVKVVDLRLLSGNTAVHSDMLMWHPDEPAPVAALQLLNILFSVPQMSVRLAEVPDDHLQMIRYYTRYWVENRSVFLDGAFEALQPLANYPVIRGHDGDKQIVALYGDHLVRLDGTRPTARIDVVNGKTSEGVVLDVTVDLGTYRYRVTDHLGTERDAGTLRLDAGVHRLLVPPAGLLALERTGDGS